jgi:hypothetical protein
MGKVMKLRWVPFLLIALTLIATPALGSVSVTDITPTFSSVQTYVNHGLVFVKVTVFDYNSWRSVKSVTVTSYGVGMKVTEQVMFVSNGTGSYFRQTAGNAFYAPASYYSASNSSDSLSAIANITVLFAFTKINGSLLNITARDIYGKETYSSIQIQGGYLGNGVAIGLPLLLIVSLISSIIAIILKGRREMKEAKNMKRDIKWLR